VNDTLLHFPHFYAQKQATYFATATSRNIGFRLDEGCSKVLMIINEYTCFEERKREITKGMGGERERERELT